MRPSDRYRRHRFRFGAAEMVVACDGPIDVGRTRDILRLPLAREGDAGVPVDGRLGLSQNALAMRSDAGWIVFETGTGSVEGHPLAGRLPAALADAGVRRRDVVALMPSHGHMDHVGGIVDRQGRPNYPDASIHMMEAEVDHWLDGARLSGMGARSALVARRNLGPSRERIVHFGDGDEIMPGIHAMATPGHTVCHTSFLIAVDGDQLFVSGDLAHHPAQLQRPDIATSFDLDPSLAAASRRRMLDFLASSRTKALFYHFAWPGLGYVEKRGAGFCFVPVTLRRSEQT